MIQVKDQIYHLGLRDWELRNFHGHELSTFNGSSYNSYLIRDEKPFWLIQHGDPVRNSSWIY